MQLVAWRFLVYLITDEAKDLLALSFYFVTIANLMLFSNSAIDSNENGCVLNRSGFFAQLLVCSIDCKHWTSIRKKPWISYTSQSILTP